MKLLIFTYAPAGLGHLRVADALVDSRPKEYPYVVFGSRDRLTGAFHRFTSTNPLARKIFTSSQYGIREDVVTAIYRTGLLALGKKILKELKEIVAGYDGVSEVWILATHFGLAHQVGAIKRQFLKETGVKIKLALQVTDDTSQHIWCVRGADVTFVPSLETKKELEVYSAKKKMGLYFSVIPYPISAVLTDKIATKSAQREDTFKTENEVINVAVPISGAAVGLEYLAGLITEIVKRSSRFHFWIPMRASKSAGEFAEGLSQFDVVHVIKGKDDNETVNLYEQLYCNHLIHIEITKPSEQSFKAILPPSCVGGPIMLFTAPVGRQEAENVEFLQRHKLMGSCYRDTCRAVRLPDEPITAADFVISALEDGLFLTMSRKNYQFSEESLASGEIGTEGTKMFWQEIKGLFERKTIA